MTQPIGKTFHPVPLPTMQGGACLPITVSLKPEQFVDKMTADIRVCDLFFHSVDTSGKKPCAVMCSAAGDASQELRALNLNIKGVRQ